MEENEISRCVIGAAIDVHKHLARISHQATQDIDKILAFGAKSG